MMNTNQTLSNIMMAHNTFYCCFTAQGHGAKGENEYKFSLEFLEPVKPEVLIIWFGISKINKLLENTLSGT